MEVASLMGNAAAHAVPSMKVFRVTTGELRQSNSFISNSSSSWEIRCRGCYSLQLRDVVLRSSPAAMSTLTNNITHALQPQRQQLQQLTRSVPKSTAPRVGRTATRATLLEPTDLSAKSLLEFGKLADDLNFDQNPVAPPPSKFVQRSNSTIISSSCNSRAVRAGGAGKTPLLQQQMYHRNTKSSDSSFSGSVGEALTSHAKLRRSRSLEENKRMQREMIPLHRLRQGGFVEDSLMYRQIFVIRSYEVGADRTTSVQTIVSLFQEMALCHVHLLGVAGDGFGATRSMNPLGLIWVITRMHVQVERYPCWPEVVEIDTWVAQAGRNGMRRDWVMRCYQTGEVLARATSTWCMMHSKTRRLAKFPDVVRDEINFTFINDRFAFSPPSSSCSDQNVKIGKLNNNTAQFVKSDLKPSREDLDMNQHVSNLKYISWVFESIPVEHFQKHELRSMTLEYRRECHSNDVVESLGSPSCIKPVCESSDTKSVQVNNPAGTTKCDKHAAEFHELSNIVSSSSNMNGNGACTCSAPSSSSSLQVAQNFKELKNSTNEISAAHGLHSSCDQSFTHLLRLQGVEEEILRGRTVWKPR